MPNLRLLWKKSIFPKGKSFTELLGYVEEQTQANMLYYSCVIAIASLGIIFWVVLLFHYCPTSKLSWLELIEKTFPSLVWSSMVATFSILERERYKQKVYKVIGDRFRTGEELEQEQLLERMRETVWAEFFKGDEVQLFELFKESGHADD
jgi:hypothetical protein